MTAETNDAGMTFAQWWAAADAYCTTTSGLGLDDLSDGPSWDAWHDGESPAAYVDEQLADNGFER